MSNKGFEKYQTLPLLPTAVIETFYWHHYIKHVEAETVIKDRLGIRKKKKKVYLHWYDHPAQISVCRKIKIKMKINIETTQHIWIRLKAYT